MTWHGFLIIETSQNKHQGMTWLKYITIHPRINIRLQYIRNTDEYIPKLQLHQHSLLTRKVFSWHNLSAQVFFSVSFGSSSSPCHLHLQVISIFKSSSSGSGSSSLDLDHHLIWIITIGSSSLDHHGCYLMILLVRGIFTEPTLFHAGCRPSLHVVLLQNLHLTPS